MEFCEKFVPGKVLDVAGGEGRNALWFAERGWHAQIWAHAPDLPELAPQLLPLGLPLVIDHMGRMNTSHGLNNPGFQFIRKKPCREIRFSV